MPEEANKLITGLIGIASMNWLQQLIFVFVVKYMLVFHNLMQMTNISDDTLVFRFSILFWAISVLAVILDSTFATEMEDTAPYLILKHGKFVIDGRNNLELCGHGILVLSILALIVFCIVQVRIEIGNASQYVENL